VREWLVAWAQPCASLFGWLLIGVYGHYVHSLVFGWVLEIAEAE
jgi:hypothetical protein